MKRNKRNLLLTVTAVGLLLAAVSAHADPLSVILDDPNLTAIGGQTIYFYGTITNNDPTNTYNLDCDGTTIDPSLTFDDTGFQNNTPLFLLPGDSSGDVELFSLYIPDGEAVGLYTGQYQIQGNDGGDTGDFQIGEADISVDVTPEPSSLLLMGTGMLLIAGLASRKAIVG